MTVALAEAKIIARDLKQALYDRDPSLCRQPIDDWLNAAFQVAAERWGSDPSAILLQTIVGLECSINVSVAMIDEEPDATVRDAHQHRQDDMRLLHKELNAMRSEMRATPADDPTEAKIDPPAPSL